MSKGCHSMGRHKRSGDKQLRPNFHPLDPPMQRREEIHVVAKLLITTSEAFLPRTVVTNASSQWRI